jgi:hypothetical protein
MHIGKVLTCLNSSARDVVHFYIDLLQSALPEMPIELHAGTSPAVTRINPVNNPLYAHWEPGLLLARIFRKSAGMFLLKCMLACVQARE